MNLHKKLAAMLLVASTLLALFFLFDAIYSKDGLFENFSGEHLYIPHKYYYPYLILPSLFAYGVFTCLYFVLRISGEQKWISTSIIIWLVSKVAILVFALFLRLRGHISSILHIELYAAVYTFIPMAYMYFAFLFIRHKNIKGYLLSTATISLVGLLYPMVSRSLYDEYGQAWLLLNKVMVMRLAHIPVLLLSIKLYLQSRAPLTERLVADTGTDDLN